MVSPPLTPIHLHGPSSPLDVSPGYSPALHRRTSSFSSHHDRSPITSRRPSHRFSNGSAISADLMSSAERGSGGLGNLADELEQLDDEDYEDDTLENTLGEGQIVTASETTRDSGIDVSYNAKRTSIRDGITIDPRDSFQDKLLEEEEEEAERSEDDVSRELEESMNNIARMVKSSSVQDDPLIGRAVALLQDLGNQASLEAGAQRLTTSTNSLSSHLGAQTRDLQNLLTGLLSPISFTATMDPALADETAPLVEALLRDLPIPDPQPLQGIQRLDRENTNVVQTLSQLMDTLQMGKQATNTASRHLRTTQTMVAELRRERERADAARQELKDANVDDMIRAKYCAKECQNVLAGFESFCTSLRASLIEHD